MGGRVVVVRADMPRRAQAEPISSPDTRAQALLPWVTLHGCKNWADRPFVVPLPCAVMPLLRGVGEAFGRVGTAEVPGDDENVHATH